MREREREREMRERERERERNEREREREDTLKCHQMTTARHSSGYTIQMSLQKGLLIDFCCIMNTYHY